MRMNFKYIVRSQYNVLLYRAKTIDIETPVDRYGFILPSEMVVKACEYLKDAGINYEAVLWVRSVSK